MTLIIFSIVSLIVGIMAIGGDQGGKIILMGTLVGLTVAINKFLLNFGMVTTDLMQVLSIDNLTSLI